MKSKINDDKENSKNHHMVKLCNIFAVEVSIILLRILAKKTDIRPAVENKIMQIEK